MQSINKNEVVGVRLTENESASPQGIHPRQRGGKVRAACRSTRYLREGVKSVLISLVWIVMPIITPTTAWADYKSDIGFTALQAELGNGIPFGRSIVVTHTEAKVMTTPEGGDASQAVATWVPNPAHPDLVGKTLFNSSTPVPSLYSGHATSVGALFYGNNASISSGIEWVESYLADHWIDSGLLLGGMGDLAPRSTASRVANHSWIGNTDNTRAGDLLRRLDWLIDRDEFIQVVGLSNGATNPPLLAGAYNALAVGRTDGRHGLGSGFVDEIYSAGRTKPDLVVPQGTTSAAAPVVAAASVLLAEHGQNSVELSSDPEFSSKYNRRNMQIFNASRSEVIKAVLMAGADRSTGNSTGFDITDYRQTAENQTDNGLDRRFGAGQLNIFNSYHILDAGEQNSIEDKPATSGAINLSGFDYDPRFGGLNNSNGRATYQFSTGPGNSRINAALVWNIQIDSGDNNAFTGLATLHDLDLLLYDITGSEALLVAHSSSRIENSEHIWSALESNRRYLLRVQVNESGGAFLWDYALAWRIEVDSDGDGIPDNFDNCTLRSNPAQTDTDNDGYGNSCDPDYDNNLVVNFNDFVIMRNAFYQVNQNIDLDGNGIVNFADMAILRQLLYQAPGPSGLAP